MAYENNDKKMDSVYSKRIRAGKRRTYFFDVRATKGNDYFLTITESRKRFDDNGYDRHKIFLYKEDFNKFVKAMQEAVDFVKTDLMPDFDFDAFNHEYPEGEGESMAADAPPAPQAVAAAPAPEVSSTDTTTESAAPQDNLSSEEVDKW
ncbi:MAG: DUF3276 family protein [Sediminibacterium sp.]|nr:DUF3276 family protein [Sediminibacterium sp.]